MCGEDPYSGQSFEHRRGWLAERFELLAGVFAVDICAFAVMSNHYHLVLRIDEARAKTWSDDEVVARVGRVFTSPFADIDQMTARQRRDKIALWRVRLASLSWMMRCLNEWVARRANREDDCKGRFWEGRFRSQALLDNGALLACMSYVDLNPVRAQMATSLEQAEHTSIQRRLRAAKNARNHGPRPRGNKGAKKRGKKGHEKAQPWAPAGLAPMEGERPDAAEPAREALPISLEDYTALLEWTGRAVRCDPKTRREQGVLSGPPAALLGDTGLVPAAWLDNVVTLGARFPTVLGAPERVDEAAEARGLRWCKGKRRAGAMYAAG